MFFLAIFKASSLFWTIPSEPGIVGHFAFFAMDFAFALSPSIAIDLWSGPIKFILQLSQIDAKCAFSLKKP